jgi:hypothetical protein
LKVTSVERGGFDETVLDFAFVSLLPLAVAGSA